MCVCVCVRACVCVLVGAGVNTPGTKDFSSFVVIYSPVCEGGGVEGCLLFANRNFGSMGITT